MTCNRHHNPVAFLERSFNKAQTKSKNRRNPKRKRKADKLQHNHPHRHPPTIARAVPIQAPNQAPNQPMNVRLRRNRKSKPRMKNVLLETRKVYSNNHHLKGIAF
jgi:hypothetical protein